MRMTIIRGIILGCLAGMFACGQAEAQSNVYMTLPGGVNVPAQTQVVPRDPVEGYSQVPAPSYSAGQAGTAYYPSAPVPAGQIYSPPSTASPSGAVLPQTGITGSMGYPVAPPVAVPQSQGRSQVSIQVPTETYMEYQGQRYLVPPRRLYADPIEVFDTFDYLVPRKHAFAAQGMPGPDPGIHSTLPTLKRSGISTVSRPAATAAVPQKPVTTTGTAQVPDGQTSAGAAQASQPATASGTGTPVQTTPENAPATQSNGVQTPVVTPGTLPTPNSASPTPVSVPTQVNGQATAQSAQPVMPAFTPQPRGTSLQ